MHTYNIRLYAVYMREKLTTTEKLISVCSYTMLFIAKRWCTFTRLRISLLILKSNPTSRLWIGMRLFLVDNIIFNRISQIMWTTGDYKLGLTVLANPKKNGCIWIQSNWNISGWVRLTNWLSKRYQNLVERVSFVRFVMMPQWFGDFFERDLKTPMFRTKIIKRFFDIYKNVTRNSISLQIHTKKKYLWI